MHKFHMQENIKSFEKADKFAQIMIEIKDENE